MGLCYYALGWRKVPRLETTTVTYYHSENTMNKGFDNIGDRLKEDFRFLYMKRIAEYAELPAFISRQPRQRFSSSPCYFE